MAVGAGRCRRAPLAGFGGHRKECLTGSTLQQRKQRPNIELVLDDVDVQLQREAANLIESINALEAQLIKAKDCYASLQRSRLELEAQIGVKDQSIYIDEVKCVTTRQGVVIQAY